MSLPTRRFLRPGALVGLVLLLGAVAGVACTDDDTPDGSPEPTSTGSPPSDAPATATPGAAGDGAGAPIDFSDVVAEVAPSVVLIESVGTPGSTSGSGVVLDREGHVLTNFHVVQGQQNLKVTLMDGSASLATIVGTDPANDLAVIHASDFASEVLHPARFGDSDQVRAGQPVFAIGNPFSQRFTVTSGIISATNRTSQSAFTGRSIRDVLQTDAALNPGNSGGPLFNLAGEVIGINTSIENPEGRVFAGIGFAVPANTAQRFLPQMLAGEDIQHPQLGVSTVALDEVEAGQLGVSVNRGLYVTTVTPGSAAERSGIRVGDIIRTANGEAIRSFVDLIRAIDDAEVGEEIAITVSRGGEEVGMTAILQPWDLN